MPSSLFGRSAALFPPPEPSAGGEEEVAYGTGGKGGWSRTVGTPSGDHPREAFFGIFCRRAGGGILTTLEYAYYSRR